MRIVWTDAALADLDEIPAARSAYPQN